MERLFERYRQRGDRRALAKVFDRTAPELLRVAMHLARDPAEAEDLVQACFLAAIERAESYDPKRRLMPWLTGILSNQARLAARRARRTIDGARLPRRPDEEPTEFAERREARKRILAALDELDEPYREVVTLKLLYDLEPAAIAHALGRAPGTVRSQLFRGLERVRKRLPAGLAVAVLGVLPEARGLAAVRTEVLATGAWNGVAAAGGIAMGKKTLVVAVAVVLSLSGTAFWLLHATGAPEATRARSPRAALDDAERARSESPAISTVVESPPAPTLAKRGGAACGWFSPWRNKEPTLTLCRAVVAAMRPLGPSRAACLSDRWLVAVLQSHCATAVVLTPGELTMLVNALAGDVAKTLLSASLSNTSAGQDFLLAEVLARRPEIMSSSSWAAYCSRLDGKAKGGVLAADPRMIAIAKRLLESRSVDDSQWWRQFWEGLPEDLSAIHARKAVFEAVAQSSDPQQHERAFRMFAGFEDTRSPNGNFGLVALGKTLHSVSFLKSGEALSAIASEREANWRRVLLWSLDPSAMWPQRRGEIDSAVANAITDVLRQQPTATDELYFRLDLLGQAWRVLGPRLAAEEFREFTVSRVQNHREAASRVATAVDEIARNRDSKQPGDQEAFDAAEAHLSALFASNRYPLNNLVALVLQDSRTGERSARDILVRALGSQIRTLRKDLYKLLVR